VDKGDLWLSIDLSDFLEFLEFPLDLVFDFDFFFISDFCCCNYGFDEHFLALPKDSTES
jgi:hypothetical protein